MEPREAEALLREKGGDGEIWVRHCYTVQRVARLLGEKFVPQLDLDLDLLGCAALLHDIGRAVTHGLWHPWEGWLLLERLGEPLVARSALTHWLKGRSLPRVFQTSPGIDRTRVREIFSRAPSRPLTLVDHLVSMADVMVSHDQVVSLTCRFLDLRERYGDNPWLRDSEWISRAQFSRFSRLAGMDLEDLVLKTCCS